MLLDMLPGMPRPLTPNNTAITLITDHTDSVSVAVGFNFLECLIGYKHTSLQKKTGEEKTSLTFHISSLDQMLLNEKYTTYVYYFSILTFTWPFYLSQYIVVDSCGTTNYYLNSNY